MYTLEFGVIDISVLVRINKLVFSQAKRFYRISSQIDKLLT
jgi:hypothetical protein